MLQERHTILAGSGHVVSARAGRFAPQIDILAMHHTTTAEVAVGIVPESDYESDEEGMVLPAHCVMPVAAFAYTPPRPPVTPAAAAWVIGAAKIRTRAPTPEEEDQ